MDKLMSVEEVAEYLGLEYKTVYRLVRSGDLPAARIGRIYRVGQSDLLSYIERQKQVVYNEAKGKEHVALSNMCCSSCTKQILSELSIASRCEVCQGVICSECFGIKKIKLCKQHQ